MNQCSILGNVSSVETMGLVDGPGIRFVVFLQGCNLRCLYCHNPETWSFEEKNKMSVEELVDKVLKYKSYICKHGGVTFSGGEPLLQSEFIYECCKRLKKEDIHICLDTAGEVGDFDKLIDLIDLFIVDVKSVYEEEYKYITGKEIKVLDDFMETLQKTNKPIWLRQVIVPGINDDEKHIVDLAMYANKFRNVEKVELLAYHTMGEDKYKALNMKYRLEGIVALSNEKLEELNQILKDNLQSY